VQATSMGTVVDHHMERINLFHAAPDEQLKIMGRFLLTPALVDPRNIPKDMGVRFIPGMAADTFKEMALRTPPKEALLLLHALTKYGLHKKDVPALTNQLFGLLRGIKEEKIDEVVAHVPTIVVAGQKDSLAQWRMWHRIEARHGDTLKLKEIPRRGHALGLRGNRAALAIAKLAAPSIEALAQNEAA
jgi:hypothetical protein